jgi:hypothetical protein
MGDFRTHAKPSPLLQRVALRVRRRAECGHGIDYFALTPGFIMCELRGPGPRGLSSLL